MNVDSDHVISATANNTLIIHHKTTQLHNVSPQLRSIGIKVFIIQRDGH